MHKSLRCRVAFHKWVKAKNPDGEPYWHCARCGKDESFYEGPIAAPGGGGGGGTA